MNTPLLSQYRNPPFKPPSRVRSPNPPRSPKRKRSDDHIPPLTIDTTLAHPAPEDHVSGTDSPRMRVAQQLNDLNIDPPRLVERRRMVTPIRKRIKRSPPASRLSPEVCITVKALETTSSKDGREDVVDETSLHALEIEETPGCRDSSNGHEHSTSNSSPNHISTRVSSDIEQSSNERSTPSSTSVPAEIPEPIFTNRGVSPLPSQEDLTADQAAFTWREDEITGHEIDTSGDDDGEGINGVGFRPTPAIAYARKQRRKQQVNEWKAREAREARQRRFERRRGAEMSIGKAVLDVEAMKRNVRFAGVD